MVYIHTQCHWYEYCSRRWSIRSNGEQILTYLWRVIPTLKNFFYWSTVDWQFSVNFFCKAKWLSYTHTHIFFFIFFSIMVCHRMLNSSPCAIQYNLVILTFLTHIYNFRIVQQDKSHFKELCVPQGLQIFSLDTYTSGMTLTGHLQWVWVTLISRWNLRSLHLTCFATNKVKSPISLGMHVKSAWLLYIFL